MSAQTVALRLTGDLDLAVRIESVISGLQEHEQEAVLNRIDEYQEVGGVSLDGDALLRAVAAARDRVVDGQPRFRVATAASDRLPQGPRESTPPLFHPEGAVEEEPSRFRETDIGLARRLATEYGKCIRWVGREKRFYWFDGTIWLPDYGRQVDAFQKDSVHRLLEEAAALPVGNEQAIKAALRATGVQRIRAAVELVRSEPGIAIEPSAFDVDPLVLNCPNGLLDLQTLELREHRADDLCTQVTAAPYCREARSEVWDRFLERTIPEPALRDWAQRALGYCVGGTTDADLIVVVRGPGGTGKSTLMHAVLAALGSYGTTTPFETFARHDRKPGQATPELESLIGHRLVCSFEGSGSLRLSEERLKGIASGDRSRSRGLFRDEREYAATFKVVLVTNDRPVVRGDDDALWRRLRILQLVHKVPDGEIDRQLRARMQRDPEILAATLAWLVEGWRLYRERGLEPTEEVRRATCAYRDAVDRVHAFLVAETVLELDGFAPNEQLKNALAAWNGENDEELAWTDIVKVLKQRDCRSCTRRVEGKALRGWQGVRLGSRTPALSPDSNAQPEDRGQEKP